MRACLIALPLVLGVVVAACPQSPPIDGVEGEGDADEGEGDANEGEGDASEGEGDANEGEGDANEGEGDANAGEGEGDPQLPPFVFVGPEGSFCLGACQLQVGRTLQLQALALVNGQPSESPALWSVSDDAVASIDDTGLVTGLAVGTVTVTADVDGVLGTVDVDVVASATVDHLTVEPSELTLAVGETAQLNAQAFDADNNVVTDAEVTFTAPQVDIATVDNAGIVTAVGAGQTIVIVTSGSAFGQVQLTVTGP